MLLIAIRSYRVGSRPLSIGAGRVRCDTELARRPRRGNCASARNFQRRSATSCVSLCASARTRNRSRCLRRCGAGFARGANSDRLMCLLDLTAGSFWKTIWNILEVKLSNKLTNYHADVAVILACFPVQRLRSSDSLARHNHLSLGCDCLEAVMRLIEICGNRITSPLSRIVYLSSVDSNCAIVLSPLCVVGRQIDATVVGTYLSARTTVYRFVCRRTCTCERYQRIRFFSTAVRAGWLGGSIQNMALIRLPPHSARDLLAKGANVF